jgi:hypothetical protein
MKKYFIALFFGMSLMSMQTVSAATLTITEVLGKSTITSPGPGSTVSGFTGGVGAVFDINLSGLGTSGLGDLVFSFSPRKGSPVTTFFNVNPITGLIAGDYFLTILGKANFRVSATDTPVSGNNVPVPAAVWLFGSALMGLLGVARRKSQPALAA